MNHSLEPTSTRAYIARIYEVAYDWFDYFSDIFFELLTGKPPLQRALECPMTNRATFVRRIEKKLTSEKRPYDDIMQRICDSSEDPREIRSKFTTSMHTVYSLNGMQTEVDLLRQAKYDSTNLEHERMLLDLWKAAYPGVELNSRVTRQWMALGFQGTDPQTDFRGMGVLSLHQMLHFARDHHTEYLAVKEKCDLPFGVPYAITSITITSFCVHLLNQGLLKNHFYNVLSAYEEADLQHFNEVHRLIFTMFVNFWVLSKAPSIMSFNLVRKEFEERMIKCLLKEDCDLYVTLMTGDY